jgi:hypothetical protein
VKYEDYDWLVPVRGKRVLTTFLAVRWTQNTPAGDDWKKNFHKKLAQFFPAIRVRN